MALFLSTYSNKVDKKGRVSVPAQFRAVLSNQNFAGVIVYNSFVNDCIEASSMERIERISSSIDMLDPFSNERDAFATTILGSSVQLAFDGEGRILLPSHLLEDIEITDKAVFVGKGQTFEIWNPDKFELYAKEARALAKEHRASLRLSAGNPGSEN
ncbi:MAG: division/cell wall cluster transcriptional repressor MraZ [Rickettsiales bacterium]|nr:division/cell wall cluster transcriptional repressor MraZ [Rickettsiales bacterium]